MRLIGPNCIGAINTDPARTAECDVRAAHAAVLGGSAWLPRAGRSVWRRSTSPRRADLGFSSLVSMGNKADISGNDLLGYWHTDPRTDVILLYLESFGNPRKFARFARAIGRSKPIVALKSGRSAVGARATASHTGALLSASDVTVDALFHQAGVIRTDTLDEMLDVAELLVHQPLPAGNRVAIVTNAGGPAVMCADTCEAHGLELPPLSEATQARLREFLPAEASVANPVDMLAAATAEQYAQSIRAIAEDPNIDALISIFLPPLATQPDDVARSVLEAVDGLAAPKPVLAVFMSAQPLPAVDHSGWRPRARLSHPRAGRDRAESRRALCRLAIATRRGSTHVRRPTGGRSRRAARNGSGRVQAAGCNRRRSAATARHVRRARRRPAAGCNGCAKRRMPRPSWAAKWRSRPSRQACCTSPTSAESAST